VNRQDEHVVFEELAAGHALSALEPEDEQLFLQHLARCTRCADEVAEHQATLALLAYAGDAGDPPPAVLEGIRAGIGAQGSTGRRGTEAGASTAGVSSLAAARKGRSARSSRGAGWLGAAAAAALVLSLGAWNLSLQADRSELRERAERYALAVQELGRADSRNVPLEGEGGEVVAVAVVQDREVSLVLDGLEPNSSGTSYVLWAQGEGGDLQPVDAFDVTGSGTEVVRDLEVEGGTAGVRAFHVSLEPGDTVPTAPGSAPVASGRA
jgi:anti-sigma factor RsiW